MTASDRDRAAVVWARSPVVLHRSVGFGVLLLVPGQAEPVAVTGAGGDLWALLDEPKPEHELVATLARAYAAEADVVRGDVEVTLATLAALGAVAAHEGTDA